MKIIIPPVIIGILLVSGCAQTGEVIDKGQPGNGGEEAAGTAVSCDEAGLIIQGIAYEDHSLTMLLANTGKKDLSIKVVIKDLAGNYHTYYLIEELEAGKSYNQLELDDVNEDIDTVSVVSRECPEVIDFLARGHIIGLE